MWKLKQNNLVLLKDELENPQLDLLRNEVNHVEMDMSGDLLDTAMEVNGFFGRGQLATPEFEPTPLHKAALFGHPE